MYPCLLPLCSSNPCLCPRNSPLSHLSWRYTPTEFQPKISPLPWSLPDACRPQSFLLPLTHRTSCLCLSSGLHHILHCDSSLRDFYWLWTVSLGWRLSVCLVFPVGTWPVVTGTSSVPYRLYATPGLSEHRLDLRPNSLKNGTSAP